jgi:hypothetical protein
MTDNLCPKCDKELSWNGRYECESCNAAYVKMGYCPKCESELEKLQACGAANYFCNTCNELQSKSKIRFEFKPIS